VIDVYVNAFWAGFAAAIFAVMLLFVVFIIITIIISNGKK
jgi:hypothetical protein